MNPSSEQTKNHTESESQRERKVWVVIPAAGIGTRMQSELPKQYLTINAKTVLEHTLRRFANHPAVAGIMVALNPQDRWWQSMEPTFDFSVPLKTVTGGQERSDSVFNALESLSRTASISQSAWVMVHDAARPCVSHKDINALVGMINNDAFPGGILASPVHDTMKRARSGSCKISHTESREDLWHALTPQLFRLGDLMKALQEARKSGYTITDEASAIEQSGQSPILVEGSSHNIKITRPGDLELAAWLLEKESENS